jgi:hypothetical protein
MSQMSNVAIGEAELTDVDENALEAQPKDEFGMEHAYTDHLMEPAEFHKMSVAANAQRHASIDSNATNAAPSKRQTELGLPSEEAWEASRREVAAIAQPIADAKAQARATQVVTQPWPVDSSTTTSFNSTTSEAPLFDPYQAQAGGNSMFPGRHDFTFEQPGEQHPHFQQQQQALQHHHMHPQPQVIQAYQADQVPQPQFDTVPNTSAFSPMSFAWPQPNSMNDMGQVIPSQPQVNMAPAQQAPQFPQHFIPYQQPQPQQQFKYDSQYVPQQTYSQNPQAQPPPPPQQQAHPPQYPPGQGQPMEEYGPPPYQHGLPMHHGLPTQQYYPHPGYP